MMWLILLIIVLVCSYYNWIYRPHTYWKDKGIIHLKPKPFIGHMGPQLMQSMPITEMIHRFYRTTKEKNAKYIGIYNFLKPLLIVTDLELIKKITVKDFSYFVDHMKFIDEEMDPIFGRNLFALRGKNWREMRNTLSPAFTTSKMRAMFSLINECAEQMTQYFLKEASSANTILILDMKDIFTRFSNDVIASATFGYKCDSLQERDNIFYTMSKDACDFTGLKSYKFLMYAISPTLMKLFKIKIFSDKICNFFRTLVVDSVTQREKEGIIRPDMIHLLMQARNGQLKHEESSPGTSENSGNKTELSDDDITAQAVLFFFAGFDTSSTLMCYIAYELATNPEIQERLQEEIDSEMNKSEGQVGYDVLMKMIYLEMVVSETLRKWPPSLITDRLTVKSYELEPARPGCKPVILESRTPLWIPIFSIQRDPAYFPDPERFDPERFNTENKKNINPYAYIPFGLGPRNCIGSRFALMESKCIIVHLLSKFNFEVVEKTSVPVKLCRKSFNLNVEGGMWIGLRPRTT